MLSVAAFRVFVQSWSRLTILSPKMGAKKSRPPAVPRLHEMKLDDVVAKAHKAVQSSRRLMNQSRVLNENAQKLIKKHRGSA